MTRGVAVLASPRVPSLFFRRGCGGRLEGWRLRRAPECQVFRRDCGGRLEGWLLWRAPECQVYFFAAIAEDDSRGGCFGEPPSAQFFFLPRLRRTTRGVAALASPRVPSFFFRRDCGGRLEGWLLWRAPEYQVCFFAAIAEDDSRGGCFGKPPSAKFLFSPRLRRTTRGVAALASPRVPSFFFRRDCGGRLEGWLLWRAPECRVSFFAAIAEDDSRGGCFGKPPSAK